jgi:hypothetical protein
VIVDSRRSVWAGVVDGQPTNRSDVDLSLGKESTLLHLQVDDSVSLDETHTCHNSVVASVGYDLA